MFFQLEPWAWWAVWRVGCQLWVSEAAQNHWDLWCVFKAVLVSTHSFGPFTLASSSDSTSISRLRALYDVTGQLEHWN